MIRLTREKAKDYIKENCTEDYLLRKGIPVNRNITCLTGTHKDKNPSMGYDARAKNLHCFTCEARLDVFDLIGMDYGITDFNGQLRKACELYDVEIVNESTGEYKPRTKAPELEAEETTHKYDPYIAECNQRLQKEYSDSFYMAQRGISLKTLIDLEVGFDPKYQQYEGAEPVPAIIIPLSNGYFTPRAIDPKPGKPKTPYRKGDKRGLHHAEALEDTEHAVIICEGESDSIAIYEAGGNAVGIPGTGGVNLLLSALKKRKSETTLVIALDNDDAGRKATERIEQGIKTLIEEKAVKPENVRYIVLNPYHNENDANDMLLANRQLFRRDISEICRNPYKWYYVNTRCASSFIDEFRDGIKDRANTPAVSTGFRNLDNALDGGLYPGLMAIGAVSSLGKTTLIQQISDNIAYSGHDVIYVSLEMSRLELMAKSISRLTYTNTLMGECGGDERNAKTTRGILDGSRYRKYSQQEMELIGLSVRDYSEIAKHIYIEEGVGNIGTREIRGFVETHIAMTGNKPILFVDYLQIIAPADVRSSDKQNMDKSILELKRISRDFGIPVVVISSFNRSNYVAEEGVTELAFKESGSIEYGVDVLIGLEFSSRAKTMEEVRQAKSRNPRDIDLKIIKNRNAGIPAEPLQFSYNPLFNYFEEV